MIVLDASVVLDVVTAVEIGREIAARIEQTDDEFIAPDVVDLEVLQALRRQVRLGQISPERAGAAVALLGDLPLTRMSHAPLIGRIWELRDNLTAYDAAYLVLAEAMGAAVWTRDTKFSTAPGHHALIVVI